MRKYWSVFSKLTWKQVREELWKPIGDLLISLLVFIPCILWLYKVAAMRPGRTFRLIGDLAITPVVWECLLIVGSSVVLATLAWFVLVVRATVLYENMLQEIKLEEPVTFDFGQTLTDVMKKIRREPLEYLALCDENGKVLYTGTRYDASSTRLREDDIAAVRKIGGLVELHNHPDEEAAFSSGDFSSAVYYKVSKSVLIAKRMVFELELPEDSNNINLEELKTFVDQQYDHTIDLMHLAGCIVLKDRNGKSCFVRQKDARLASMIVCSNVAREYGMKFTATPYRKSKYYQEWRPLVLVKLLLTGMRSLSTR